VDGSKTKKKGEKVPKKGQGKRKKNGSSRKERGLKRIPPEPRGKKRRKVEQLHKEKSSGQKREETWVLMRGTQIKIGKLPKKKRGKRGGGTPGGARQDGDTAEQRERGKKPPQPRAKVETTHRTKGRKGKGRDETSAVKKEKTPGQSQKGPKKRNKTTIEKKWKTQGEKGKGVGEKRGFQEQRKQGEPEFNQRLVK